MYDFVMLITLVVFVLLIIGFFNPNKSLFWFKGERTKKKSFIIYFISLFVLGILSEITKPQSVIDEENKKQEELVQQDKIQKEEEELNSVYLIDDCNDFKDNTTNYKNKTIEDVFNYGPENLYEIRDIIEKTKTHTKDKTVSVIFYKMDKNGNTCNISLDIPVDLNVPNITNIREKLLINFNCTQGSLKSGNIVNSISRTE